MAADRSNSFKDDRATYGNAHHWPWGKGGRSPNRAERQETEPRISIVTPSYNQGRFLEETIRSVLLQDYPNLEYIVIDGGSTDESVDIIRKYANWLTYWTSEPDRGQAHALNKGFGKATGELFCYLNSDDVLMPGTLSAVAAAWRRIRSRRAIAACGGVMFGEGREERRVRPDARPSLKVWLSTDMSLFQPGVFWTRSLHEKIGGFQEDYYFCFDKEFFLQAIFLYGTYHALPDIRAAGFRLHTGSKTHTLDAVKWRENERISQKYANDERLVRILRCEQAELIAARSIEAENWAAAVRGLIRAARLAPRHVFNRFYLGACKRVLLRALERRRATAN